MSPVLKLALPAIVSNITVPLLGLVDTAIIGHMGAAEYIGAVSVGSMICSSIYWLFGFLRMGTSGLTAQEYGRSGETGQIFRSAMTIALLMGIALVLLSFPIERLSTFLMSPSPEVKPLARTYFYICILGAPTVLLQYTLTGWFIGMQDTRRPMIVAISQNIFNILASLTFVYLFRLKIEGIALGTMLAQWFAVGLGLWLRSAECRVQSAEYTLHSALCTLHSALCTPNSELCTLHSALCTLHSALPVSFLRRFFSLNLEIFLRTLCLMSVFFFFTSAGSKQGTEILAVNALLMQTWLFFSYFMDGFANAGEALSGRFFGAGDRRQMLQAIKSVFAWGFALAALFTAGFAFGLEPFLSLLTSETAIVEAARPYFPWIISFPLLAFAAFIWDGIFIGLTMSRGMLWGCASGCAAFFAAYYSLFPVYQNHALWLAFLLFLFLRAAVQTVVFLRTMNN